MNFTNRSIGAAKRRLQFRIVGGVSQSTLEERDRLLVATFAGEHRGMFLTPER
jgi:hypothetical protein